MTWRVLISAPYLLPVPEEFRSQLELANVEIHKLLNDFKVAGVLIRPHPKNLWRGLDAWIDSEDDARLTRGQGGAVAQDLTSVDMVLAVLMILSIARRSFPRRATQMTPSGLQPFRTSRNRVTAPRKAMSEHAARFGAWTENSFG